MHFGHLFNLFSQRNWLYKPLCLNGSSRLRGPIQGTPWLTPSYTVGEKGWYTFSIKLDFAYISQGHLLGFYPQLQLALRSAVFFISPVNRREGKAGHVVRALTWQSGDMGSTSNSANRSFVESWQSHSGPDSTTVPCSYTT